MLKLCGGVRVSSVVHDPKTRKKGNLLVRVRRVNARDADATKVNRRLDHLVQELARVRLEPRRHLDLVQPALGVLAGGALERDVESGRARLGQSVRAALGELVDRVRDVLDLVKVDRVDADVGVVPLDDLFKVVEAPLRVVDRDEVRGAAHRGPPAGEDTDRTDAPDADNVAFFDAGVFDLVERGHKDVRDEERILVGDAFRDLDRVGLAVGDADVFRLTASKAASEVTVAEHAACG